MSVCFGASDDSVWSNFWGRLQAFKLDLWKQRKSFEDGQLPHRSIPVDKVTPKTGAFALGSGPVVKTWCVFQTVAIKTGKQSKDVVISNPQNASVTVRLRNVEEQQKWVKALVQHADDHRRWRHAAEQCLGVMSPGSVRNSFAKGVRQGSLYDQTPLIGKPAVWPAAISSE